MSPQSAYKQTGRMPLPFRRDCVSTKDTLNEKTRSQRRYAVLVIVNPQNSQAYHPHYHRYSATADSNIEPCPTRHWWNVSRETFHQHHPVPGIITLSVGCVISGIHSNSPSINPPSTQHQNRRNSGVQQLLAMLRKTSNRTQRAVYILSTNTTCVGSSPSPTGARHTRA